MDSPIYKAAVTRADVKQDAKKKSYTIYQISCSDGSRSWTIFKRYSEFHSMYTRLKVQYPSKRFPFPSKKFFGNRDPGFVEQRKLQLHGFLQALRADKRIARSDLLVGFLDPLFQCSATEYSKTAVIKGYLNKQGHNHKTWKKRYFILHNHRLYYFETDSSDKPIGSLNCLACTSQPTKIKQFAFFVVTKEQNHLILQAKDEKERSTWLGFIEKASKPSVPPPDYTGSGVSKDGRTSIKTKRQNLNIKTPILSSNKNQTGNWESETLYSKKTATIDPLSLDLDVDLSLTPSVILSSEPLTDPLIELFDNWVSSAQDFIVDCNTRILDLDFDIEMSLEETLLVCDRINIEVEILLQPKYDYLVNSYFEKPASYNFGAVGDSQTNDPDSSSPTTTATTSTFSSFTSISSQNLPTLKSLKELWDQLNKKAQSVSKAQTAKSQSQLVQSIEQETQLNDTVSFVSVQSTISNPSSLQTVENDDTLQLDAYLDNLHIDDLKIDNTDTSIDPNLVAQASELEEEYESQPETFMDTILLQQQNALELLSLTETDLTTIEQNQEKILVEYNDQFVASFASVQKTLEDLGQQLGSVTPSNALDVLDSVVTSLEGPAKTPFLGAIQAAMLLETFLGTESYSATPIPSQLSQLVALWNSIQSRSTLFALSVEDLLNQEEAAGVAEGDDLDGEDVGVEDVGVEDAIDAIDANDSIDVNDTGSARPLPALPAVHLTPDTLHSSDPSQQSTISPGSDTPSQDSTNTSDVSSKPLPDSSSEQNQKSNSIPPASIASSSSQTTTPDQPLKSSLSKATKKISADYHFSPDSRKKRMSTLPGANIKQFISIFNDQQQEQYLAQRARKSRLAKAKQAQVAYSQQQQKQAQEQARKKKQEEQNQAAAAAAATAATPQKKSYRRSQATFAVRKSCSDGIRQRLLRLAMEPGGILGFMPDSVVEEKSSQNDIQVVDSGEQASSQAEAIPESSQTTSVATPINNSVPIHSSKTSLMNPVKSSLSSSSTHSPLGRTSHQKSPKHVISSTSSSPTNNKVVIRKGLVKQRASMMQGLNFGAILGGNTLSTSPTSSSPSVSSPKAAAKSAADLRKQLGVQASFKSSATSSLKSRRQAPARASRQERRNRRKTRLVESEKLLRNTSG